jgi:hypothetical protein
VSALAIAAIVFACVSGGALLGMILRSALPQHHFDDLSKDVVKTGMGLVATMAALVLGLLVASASSAYDAQKEGLDEIAANITLLDNLLEQYGPPAENARKILHDTVWAAIVRLWPADATQAPTLGPAKVTAGGQSLYARILALPATNDAQSALRSQALQTAVSVAQERLLLIAHHESASTSSVFLVVLTFWLVVLFGSFGLFAPRNMLVIAVLMISALSVSGAIFLTLELAQPFGGLINISSAPLRDVLAHLGE